MLNYQMWFSVIRLDILCFDFFILLHALLCRRIASQPIMSDRVSRGSWEVS